MSTAATAGRNSPPALKFYANYDLLEVNDQANLTADGKALVDAYAEAHKARGGKGRVGMTPMRPFWTEEKK